MSFLGDIADVTFGRSDRRKQRKHEERMLEDQQAFQREMAQMGIQWRVGDAQAAGVHPVYALGAAVPSGQPITVGGGGSDIDYGRGVDAVTELFTGEKKAMAELQKGLLLSQIGENDARAEYYRSQAARAGQNQNNQPDAAWFSEGGASGSAAYRSVGEPGIFQLEPGAQDKLPGAHDVVKVKPSEQTSAMGGASWMEPSLSPGSKEYRLTRNMKVLLPAANDLGEALEPLSESWALMYMWYRINVDHYGEAFTKLAWQELGLPNMDVKGQYRGLRNRIGDAILGPAESAGRAIQRWQDRFRDAPKPYGR